MTLRSPERRAPQEKLEYRTRSNAKHDAKKRRRPAAPRNASCRDKGFISFIQSLCFVF